MKIDNNINKVMDTNLDIQRIVSGGGILWEQEKLGPGPQKLIAGNNEAGFYGEVESNKLITGDELAWKLGLAEGIDQYSNEPWLKFAYLGRIEYIAKKTFRRSISKQSLLNANAVYGDKQIEIKGNKYKVRLIKGKAYYQGDGDWYYRKWEIEGQINHDSEWNKLMLPIHQNAPDNWKFKSNVNSPTQNWNIGYTDKDLVTHSDYGNGSFSICQEDGEDSSYSLIRGGFGVSYSSSVLVESDYANYGWRPVLELII